jgi:DNA polymerase II small subunit/DNA polymerase delta subunit B
LILFTVNLTETKKEKIMADQSNDKPVTYNEQEQLQLQNLKTQNDSFNAWGSAISRSLHIGSDTLLVANLLQFLKNLIGQNDNQAKQLEIAAKARANTASADESEQKAS